MEEDFLSVDHNATEESDVGHDSSFHSASPVLEAPQKNRSENDPISVYQREHDRFLEEKTRASQAKKEQLLSTARAEIDAFYQKRAQSREKALSANKRGEEKFLSERASVNSSGNLWAGVGSLLDFKATVIGRDTSRMRKVLLDLKH